MVGLRLLRLGRSSSSSMPGLGPFTSGEAAPSTTVTSTEEETDGTTESDPLQALRLGEGARQAPAVSTGRLASRGEGGLSLGGWGTLCLGGGGSLCLEGRGRGNGGGCNGGWARGGALHESVPSHGGALGWDQA